jgi:hypothetical protein
VKKNEVIYDIWIVNVSSRNFEQIIKRFVVSRPFLDQFQVE